MKMLVISLLRLGDLLMSRSVLEALKKANPDRELHVLVNQGVEKAAFLFPFVDAWHIFPRQRLQNSIGDVDASVFAAFDDCKALIDALNAQEYESVINLTQNKLSAYVCGALDIDSKLGLHLNAHGFFETASQWFRYMDQFVAAGPNSTFHYNEVFFHALNLRPNIEFKTARRAASAPWKILVQAPTSDIRKTLHPVQWGEMLRTLRLQWPECRIQLFGAPGEETFLDDILSCASDIDAQKLICSLERVHEELQTSDLLITVDTSIKHLACLTEIPIVEIAIGCSDCSKTGAFRGDVLILQNCKEEQTEMDPQLIAMAAKSYYESHQFNLKILAQEYAQITRVLTTHMSDGCFWMIQDGADAQRHDAYMSILNKMAWEFSIDKQTQDWVGYGSMARDFVNSVEQKLGTNYLAQVQELSEEFENKAIEDYRLALSLLGQMTQLLRQSNRLKDFKALAAEFRQKTQEDPQYQFLQSGLDQILESTAEKNAQEFVILRTIQQMLVDFSRFQDVKAKLLRGAGQVRNVEM